MHLEGHPVVELGSHCDRRTTQMHGQCNALRHKSSAARASHTIAILLFLGSPTVFLPCAIASSAAPDKIQGCWNLLTDAPLRISFNFGESSSRWHSSRSIESHELERENVDFSGSGANDWTFQHAHRSDGGTYDTWDYRCAGNVVGNTVVGLGVGADFAGELFFKSAECP